MRVLTCFNKAALETLCQLHLIPSIVITNDWFTGLAPAFARHGHFGSVFDGTDFMHICHNLDPSYEGRLYPEKHEVCKEDLSVALTSMGAGVVVGLYRAGGLRVPGLPRLACCASPPVFVLLCCGVCLPRGLVGYS